VKNLIKLQELVSNVTTIHDPIEYPFRTSSRDNFKSCRPKQQLIDSDECQDVVANQ